MPVREESKCRLCPQNGRTKVASQIPVDGIGLAILGESPGEVEEERGQPFMGPSGRMLNMAIKQVGLERRSLWVTNVVACRPPSNDIASPEGAESVLCCRSGLKAEVSRMKAAGIRCILTLGQVAMEAMGVEGRVSKVRGSVYKVDGLFIVPTYHPSYLLRSGGKRGSDGVNLVAALQSDLQKAIAISRDGWKPPKENFNVTPTLLDVRTFCADARRNRSRVAVDIETTGLDARRGARVVVIGLATSGSDALVVPILDRGGNPYWNPEEQVEVKHELEALFADGRLLFQNCFFDIPFLVNSGWRIDVSMVEHDTLVLHSLVSPETEHNLGYIVSVYGQTPEWKESFKNRSVPILEMDQLEMRRYNARDCVVLHQVMEPMLRQLDEYGLVGFYETETRPLMKPFMEMTMEGVGFDFKHMESFKARMEQLVEEKEKAIREAYRLPPQFNFDSDDELRWLLFRQEPGKFKDLTSVLVTYVKELKDGTRIDTKLVCGYSTEEIPLDLLPDGRILKKEVVATLDHLKSKTARYDNLVALESIRRIPELYRLKGFRGLSTDGGKVKVSRDGLLSYRIQLQNRLSTVAGLVNPKQDEIDAIEDVLALIELLMSHSELSKLKTSFTSYMPHADGRIRPSWLMHGTATGRLSCLAQGTRVFTLFGWRPIETVLVGDWVFTHKERWKKVTAVLDQGIKEVWELTSHTGRHIISTNDHLFWTPEGWRKAEEVTNVCVKDSPERQAVNQIRLVRVSGKSRKALHDRHSERTWNNRTQCLGYRKGTCSARSFQSGEGFTDIPASNRGKGLQLGEKGISPSELERGMFRQERTSDDQSRNQASLCTSSSDGGGSWFERVASFLACASYRWKWRKQQSRQSGPCDECGASSSPQEVESITRRSYVGKVQVFDLSIDEDSSFIAEGFIVHNCKGPNLAQLPSRGEGADVRKFFVARPGWSIVDADFENAEVALLGYEACDDVIIDIYESGKNIHDENTKILFGLSPADPVWKEARKAAKVFQFGGLSYGGGDREIYKKVLMAAPALPLTFERFVEAKSSWMDAHPRYVEWRDRVVDTVQRDRKLYNAFGRMRVFLGHPNDIRKEGMNFMIQSAGACLINRAMIRIHDEFKRLRMATKIIMQVYDEIVLEAPDEEAPLTKEILIREMQRPFEMRGRTCMIRAEGGVGKTYGDAK